MSPIRKIALLFATIILPDAVLAYFSAKGLYETAPSEQGDEQAKEWRNA